MREREELSLWERDYLSSKITGWKVASFFFPGLWQIWSKRRWLFWWWTLIAVWLGLLAIAWGGGNSIEWAGTISWLLNVILTLVKFTEKAYRHDMPYFQRYLDEYAELNRWAKGKQREINQYEEENEERTVTYSNKNNKYDKYGFDRDGYNREWYDAYGFDRDGYNREGYNEEWFDKFWFDKNWYNYKWFDKDWFNKDGYDRRWFNKSWYDRDWYDEYWEKKNGNKKSTTKKNSTVLSKKSRK